jgi:hypothetical protein
VLAPRSTAIASCMDTCLLHCCSTCVQSYHPSTLPQRRPYCRRRSATRQCKLLLALEWGCWWASPLSHCWALWVLYPVLLLLQRQWPVRQQVCSASGCGAGVRLLVQLSSSSLLGSLGALLELQRWLAHQKDRSFACGYTMSVVWHVVISQCTKQ